MPTIRREKFTVAQSDGLAPSGILFPTENEPISQYRRPDIKPQRGGRFARMQTKANSQYAIQKTGVNSGSGYADHRGLPAAIPLLRSPDPLQKIKERSHFSPRDCQTRVRGAARKNTAQNQLQLLSTGQCGVRAQRRRRFRVTWPRLLTFS